jgi:RNA-directed DNA polymerase
LTTPTEEVWETLNRKLQGHYQYYGVTDNWRWMAAFRDEVLRLAFNWLHRRSQRSMSQTTFFRDYLGPRENPRPSF